MITKAIDGLTQIIHTAWGIILTPGGTVAVVSVVALVVFTSTLANNG